MDRHFDEELKSLKEQILEMGAMSEKMVNIAMKALMEHDVKILESMGEIENRVNHCQVDIDETCLKLIALHQPTASDLRMLLGISKINAELERVGDQAVSIANRISSVLEFKQLKPFVDMPKMVEIASAMLNESLQAFVSLNADRAHPILLRDDNVDDLRDKIVHELVTLIGKNQKDAAVAVNLILIANNFEKIADHATNIAEVVIFVAQGKDVRHHFEKLC